MQRQPIQWGGGINLLAHPRDIADNELALAQNLVLAENGNLRLRDSVEYANDITWYLNGLFSNMNVTFNIATFAANFPGNTQLLGAFGTSTASHTWVMKLSGASAPSPWTFFPNDLYFRPQSVQFGNKLYVVAPNKILVGGTQYPVAVLDFTTPTTPVSAAFAFAGTGNAGINVGLITVYRSRFVYANIRVVGNEYPNSLVFSDPYDPAAIGNDALTANGRSIRVGSEADGPISGVIEVQQTSTGSPSTSALLVLRERAAYLLTGEPGLSTDATNPLGDLTIQRLSTDIGCVSPDTIVRTPYGTLWAGPDDVWAFPHGQLPYRVGGKIRPALKAGKPNLRPAWHATYFNGKYRLAVAGSAQTKKTNPFPAMRDVYELDLTYGLPENSQDAKWMGGLRYGIVNSRVETNPSDEGMPQAVVTTRGDGTQQLRTVTRVVDDANEYSTIAVHGSKNGWEQDLHGGVRRIYPYFKTKEYTFGDPMTYKQAIATEIDITTPALLAFQVRWVADTQSSPFAYVRPRTASVPVGKTLHTDESTTVTGRSLMFLFDGYSPLQVQLPYPYVVGLNVEGTVKKYTITDPLMYAVNAISTLNAISGYVITVGSGSGPSSTTLTAATGTWAPVMDGPDLTADEAESSAVFWAIFGFTPGIYPLSAAHTTTGGHGDVLMYPPGFELNSAALEYIPFGRLP